MYFDELALKGPFGANIQHSEGYVTLKFVGKRNISAWLVNSCFKNTSSFNSFLISPVHI